MTRKDEIIAEIEAKYPTLPQQKDRPILDRLREHMDRHSCVRSEGRLLLDELEELLRALC